MVFLGYLIENNTDDEVVCLGDVSLLRAFYPEFPGGLRANRPRAGATENAVLGVETRSKDKCSRLRDSSDHIAR